MPLKRLLSLPGGLRVRVGVARTVVLSGKWEKQHENLHSPQGHLALRTSCDGCLCLCPRARRPHAHISSWFVIFTRPYGVTAQIINYSSPMESVGVYFFLLQKKSKKTQRMGALAKLQGLMGSKC